MNNLLENRILSQYNCSSLQLFDIVQCIGSRINFSYSLPSGVIADSTGTTWESLDTNVASIDNSGVAVFLKAGVARIKLKVKSSCPVINNYIIRGSTTSSITRKD